MSERERLLQEYRAMCFGVQDIKLFLDTHPFHSEALRGIFPLLSRRQYFKKRI